MYFFLDIISKILFIFYVFELSMVGKYYCYLVNGSFWGIWVSVDYGFVYDRFD